MLLKIKDVELNYEKYGQGKPLLLLHGNGEDHTIFQEAISLLAMHFTVYALDSRGHGKSTKVKVLHYEDMADDVYQFIVSLQLEKPIVYGFSDGGIIALLLAIHHSDILSRIIVSGVNIHPKGLKAKWRYLFRFCHFFTGSAQLKLMLEEPHISHQELENLQIPVDITAGEKDMIAYAHLVEIHRHLPKGNLIVFPKETHSSYVIHSEKIAQFILEQMDKSNKIGKKVHVIIDRKIGSFHPQYPDLIYPIHYGYIPNCIGGDGEEQDAYIFGMEEPIDTFDGIVIAILERENDVETKWIVASPNQSFTNQEILDKIHFQEQYFKVRLIR